MTEIPCSSMQIFCPVCLITCLLGYIALYFGKNDLWIMTSSLWCFLPAGPIPTRLFQEDPWGGLLKSPEVHGCTLTCCPASSSSDSKIHNLMVTTAKAASPTRPFLLLHEAKQHTIPCGTVHHQEGVINTFQEHPGLFVACCAASLADVRQVKVPHRKQVL